MRFADKYIDKNKGEFSFGPVKIIPLRMIVVIPCYNESEIGYFLSTLLKCEYPGVETGIVVVVNSSDKTTEHVMIQNKKTISEIYEFCFHQNNWIHLFIIEAESLPEKNSGVGWARKIGMDWAIVQFNQNEDCEGIIVSLDADTRVEKDYLKSIYNYFIEHPSNVAATIYFEHQFHHCDLRNEKLEDAITYYELYMRYYRNALLYCGFPNPIYTLGSCFAVRAKDYVAQGGMNRKKAGEDFYFLHKMAQKGEIGEINSTIIYPSARISNRVPFGTGPALQKYFDGDQSIRFTYSVETFLVLKSFFSKIECYYNSRERLKAEDFSNDSIFLSFCYDSKLVDEIEELKSNCSNFQVFHKRFYHVFNAFRVLKWLNFAEKNGKLKSDLIIVSRKILFLMGFEDDKTPTDPKLLLNLFRKIDRDRSKY